MYLKSIQLENYRNYAHLSLNFSKGLTLLVGENAQGKTNLLEAIFLLSMAKSHRTHKDQELIQWEQDLARISGIVENKNFEFPLEIVIHPKGKMARYNHLNQERLSQYIGKLNVILFAPEDLSLVKGSPQQRRRFIDAELGQVQGVYLQLLVDYQRLLKQRNAYLKQAREGMAFDALYFDILTENLVDLAIKIIDYRLSFIQELEKISQVIHAHLSDQRDHLTIAYQSSSSRLDYQKKESLKEQFIDLFRQSFDREKAQALTLYGPHRDDLIFNINGNNAQQFASQGQQRTIVLTMKLAELDYIYQATGDYPVLLLDDVLSELDDQRQLLLMQMIAGKVQTILTTTSVHSIALEKVHPYEIIEIHQGKANKGEE